MRSYSTVPNLYVVVEAVSILYKKGYRPIPFESLLRFFLSQHCLAFRFHSLHVLAMLLFGVNCFLVHVF